MELTVDQALQRGVAAHKKGKLQDAERLYRAILQSQPLHPDANHNLGLLAVSVNKAHAALPLFKTALEANPKIEQFWLSYLDALIREKQFDNAKEVLEQAKNQGVAGEKINVLETQLTLTAQVDKPKLALQKKSLSFSERRKKLAENKKKKAKKQDLKGISPSQAEINNLLHQYQTGRFEDAEKLAVSITNEFPKYQFGWKVLGLVLQQTGRVSDSLIASQKSVELVPHDAEAHHNLGNTLKELGRLDEAEASIKQAIALKPDYAGAHSDLGVTLNELGRLDEAEASYKQAIALKPDFALAHSNLGNTLKELDRIDEAIEAYIQALKINPDSTETYSNLGIALMGIGFRKPVPSLPELICKILTEKTLFRPTDISKAVISLLKVDPIIKGTIKKNSIGELVQSLQEIIINLSNIPLLLKLMAICPIPDLEFESLFKDIRSAILLSLSSTENNAEILRFQIALSSQCFANEYLYDQTELEIEALEKLENLVGNKLTAGKQPTPTELACLASYKALYQYSWIQLVTVPTELQELERRQIVEPKEEKQLRSKMPMLQEINSNVSRKVREQYEQNPYPRWIKTGLPLAPKSILAVTKDLNLNVKNSFINEISNPQILIAGCGTGQHSIETAARFKDCDVLAIDLSLSSLSYAKRKTEELGISNIDYIQADILDLGALNRQFDIIESSGVLHHMDDPMAGWDVLTGCLKAGGLMRIGLYSELARSHIVQMRHEIQQSNIGSSNDAMRSFRKKIVSSKEEHHSMIALCSDFYSMSTLRDLLFHVQEHRFTIPKIKDCLAQLGLTFCGFEADKIVQKFKSEYLSENTVYDLDKWDAFEKKNPEEFGGMYQFCCQKIV